jgi:hypothetical protein
MQQYGGHQVVADDRGNLQCSLLPELRDCRVTQGLVEAVFAQDLPAIVDDDPVRQRSAAGSCAAHSYCRPNFHVTIRNDWITMGTRILG